MQKFSDVHVQIRSIRSANMHKINRDGKHLADLAKTAVACLVQISDSLEEMAPQSM